MSRGPDIHPDAPRVDVVGRYGQRRGEGISAFALIYRRMA